MYNPKIHHRRSIRLKWYDYAQQGLYFITICVKDRQCLFGEIINEQMILNDAGRMIEKWYMELENKFPDIQCGEFIVMPNHFHCIVENLGTNPPIRSKITNSDERNPDEPVSDEPVRADLCVCPNETNEPIMDEPVSDERVLGEPVLGEHIGSPLHRVIQWFKTMSTNEYIRYVKTNNWPRFNGKLWQRNYWEHIIRNKKSYQRISKYIICNPQNWDTDTINPNNKDDIKH